MKILADVTLPHLSKLFKFPFELSTYASEVELKHLIQDHEILCCRSTLQVNETLLHNTPIRYVATASSGIDHIDMIYLQAQNITLFDAKGCNAIAVTNYIELILGALKTKGQKLGEKAGIIGYGQVGSMVAERLKKLGFSVYIYDPIKHHFSDLSDVDILCIHAGLHQDEPYPSYHLVNQSFLDQLNPKAIIINAARGELIDEHALLNHPKKFIYCTDVYANEPLINPKIIDYATLCTPHIAGHTIEAKINAVVQISQALHEVLGLQFEKPTDIYPPLPHQPYVYDPSVDTQILKKAHDKKSAFLELRRAHQYRHDNHTKHSSEN